MITVILKMTGITNEVQPINMISAAAENIIACKEMADSAITMSKIRNVQISHTAVCFNSGALKQPFPYYRALARLHSRGKAKIT